MNNGQKKIIQFPPKNQLSTDEKTNLPGDITSALLGRERIELFTAELKQTVIKAVDLGMKFLQPEDHKFKQGPSHAAQVGKVLVIPQNVLFKAMETNYLLALDNLTSLNEQKKSKHDIPDFSQQVNAHAGFICSYLIGIIRQLEKKPNNVESIKIKTEILDAGIIINQIMAEDHIDFPHYRTQFLSHQALLILNTECKIVIARLNPLIPNILLIKCLGFKRFNAQIDIIFDICQSCINKINSNSDNLTLLLPFFSPLVKKITNAFEELNKEQLTESERILVFLSMLQKLSYFAGFYFKQYFDSNKRDSGLLTNAHSLIKRLVRYILTPLQSMALTVEDRGSIFEIVYNFSNQQRGFFNQDEGKVLYSLLRKLDGFITPLALKNCQLLSSINSIRELEKSILAEQKSNSLPPLMYTTVVTSVQEKEIKQGNSMKNDWETLCVKIHEALASTKKLVPDLSEIDEKSLLSKLDEVSKNFTDQAGIRRIDAEELADKVLNVGLVIKLDKSTSNLKSTLYNLAEKILKMSNKNENTEHLKLLIYGNYALNQLESSLINQADLLIALKNITHLDLTEQKSLKDETMLGCDIITPIIESFEMALPDNKDQLILFIKYFSQKLINKKLEGLSPKDCLVVFSSFLDIIIFCFQHDLKDYAEKLITSMYHFWKKFIQDLYIEELGVRTQLSEQCLKAIEEIYKINPSLPEDSKRLLDLIKDYYSFYVVSSEIILPSESKEQEVFSKIDIFNKLKGEIINLENKATGLIIEKKKAEVNREESLKHVPMRTFAGDIYILDDLKGDYLAAMSQLDRVNTQKDQNIKNRQEFLDQIINPCGDICTYLIAIVRELQKLELMEEVIFSTQQKLLDLCFNLCEMLTDERSYLSYYHSELYGCKVLTLLSRFNEENDSELKGLIKKLVSIEVVGYPFLNAQFISIWNICMRYIRKDNGLPKNLVQLFAFLPPLSNKLVAVFDSMLELELEDDQRIEIYLSMFENFCNLANYYLTQYIVTKKSSPSLLKNAKILINTSIVKILTPLEAMKLGVATRSYILGVIGGLCHYQAQSLKTQEKEGVLLRNLLKKADCFIEEKTDLVNEIISEIIISIKSLQKISIGDDSKQAAETMLASDESKPTKLSIIQSISPLDQKVNTSNKSKSSTPEEINLNLEVADSKPVKKHKKKKNRKIKYSTQKSSSGDSAIICQPLAPGADNPAQAVTDLPKEIKSLPEHTPVKSLQQQFIEGNSKPAFEKVLPSDESKPTELPTSQIIFSQDQEVNTSKKSRSPTPEKINLNLEVAERKSVKKNKKEKLWKIKKSLAPSSPKNSAIICQPLAPRVDNTVQGETDFPKTTKSPIENTPVPKERESKLNCLNGKKKSKEKISIPESIDQNNSIELTQNNEKIHDLEKENKHLTEANLSAAQEIENLKARLAISQRKKGIIKEKGKLLETQDSQHRQEIKDLNLQLQSVQAELKKQQQKSESTDEILNQLNQLKQENNSLTISVQDMSKSNQQQIEALQIKLEQYERLIETTQTSLKLAQEALVKSRNIYHSELFVSRHSLIEKEREISSLHMQLEQQEAEYKQNSLALISAMGYERQFAVTKAVEAIIGQKIGQNGVSSEPGVTPDREQKQKPPEIAASHPSKWGPNFNFAVEGTSTTPAPGAMGKSQSPSLRLENS